jgi:hypothetical protein
MFPGYKQGYKTIVVLNLGKMPGKRYTNKEIIEKLQNIEDKLANSEKERKKAKYCVKEIFLHKIYCFVQIIDGNYFILIYNNLLVGV